MLISHTLDRNVTKLFDCCVIGVCIVSVSCNSVSLRCAEEIINEGGRPLMKLGSVQLRRFYLLSHLINIWLKPVPVIAFASHLISIWLKRLCGNSGSRLCRPMCGGGSAPPEVAP